ncbi:hypothetical protein QYF50_07180 [Paenibacillus vini]|uniref:hypothetical protein n=1 Tax=Paenibacillus vini TaxID=1476024 RepID=UPI0025B69602|nr:hypothetical protein [Paenibacillus vini]MDN4067674.1 hypothetical protein [Paenibacillus vini]
MAINTEEKVKVIEEFLTNLTNDMEGDHWSIVGIVEVKELKENGVVYGEVEGDRFTYKKQDNEFIKQWTGLLGDDYHGFLLKPIGGSKYVKISYSC